MQLDELDAAILRALTEDARRSLRDVATLVDSTPTTVGARLDRLRTAGIYEGATLRLDPARVPGSARLLTGRVPNECADAVLDAARQTTGVVEVALGSDGYLVVTLQVRTLEEEEAAVAALAAAGAEGLTARPVRRATGPPPSHLFAAAASLAEACAICTRDVGPEPVVETVDGRRVAFCCPSCRQVYMDRYARLKAAAGAGDPRA